MSERKHRSGWCSNNSHERCNYLVVNGVRAVSGRYVACTCDCHYPASDTAIATLIGATGHWGVTPPDAGADLKAVTGYLTAVNDKCRPGDLEDTYEDFSYSDIDIEETFDDDIEEELVSC